jgi:hypothetical protein
VTGTGAPWLLYANGGGTTTITVGSDTYTIPAGSTVGTSAYTGSKSVTVTATYIPPTPFSLTSMPSANSWTSVTYGNGKFVAVSNGRITASYSNEGSTWTVVNMTVAAAWYGITYGNGLFVAVAGGQSTNTTIGAYSTDGINWNPSLLPSSQKWYRVTYGNGYFVAISLWNTATSPAAYSTNGTTWTASTITSAGTVNGWTGVTYGNGKFVAVQADGTNAGAYFAQTQTLPVNFGIYNGPTTIN